MNEELQKITADGLQQVLQYVKSTEVFAVEQAPLVCQEIVRWGVVSSSIKAFVALIFVAAFWCAAKSIIKRNTGDDRMFAIFPGVCGGFAFFIFAATAHNAVMPIIAPRLYIIEQLSEVLK